MAPASTTNAAAAAAAPKTAAAKKSAAAAAASAAAAQPAAASAAAGGAAGARKYKAATTAAAAAKIAAAAAANPAGAAAAAKPQPKKRSAVAITPAGPTQLLRTAHGKKIGREVLTEVGIEKARVGATAIAAGQFFARDLVHVLSERAATWAAHAKRSQVQAQDVTEAARSLGIVLPAESVGAEALARVDISPGPVTATIRAAMGRIVHGKQPQATAEAVALVRTLLAAFIVSLFEAAARSTKHAKRPTMLAEDIEMARKEASDDKMQHKLPRGFDADIKKHGAKKGKTATGAATAAGASDDDDADASADESANESADEGVDAAPQFDD